MRITIVIPAYNEEKYIEDCLSSIIKYKSSDLLEIIVVDNNSTDSTAMIASKFSLVKVVKEENIGIAKAKLMGSQEAKGDLIAFVDADCRITKGWLETIKNEFEKNSSLVCLSGPYYHYDLPKWLSYLSYFLWSRVTFLGWLLFGYAAFGGNMVVKKSALLQINAFDSHMPSGEDYLIAKKLHENGRVKFKLNFCVLTSARRLKAEGLFLVAFHNFMNVIWIYLFHKPLYKQIKNYR